MKNFLMILSTFSILMACGEKQIEYRYVTPDVPDELLDPKVVPPGRIETIGELAKDRINQKNAAEENAAKIVSVRCILKAAAKGQTEVPVHCFTEPKT